MKKFEYLQVDYINYPSPEELNIEGENGWELILISIVNKTFPYLNLKGYYTKEIYIATFKRELKL
jgi:hypothetical protein